MVDGLRLFHTGETVEGVNGDWVQVIVEVEEGMVVVHAPEFLRWKPLLVVVMLYMSPRSPLGGGGTIVYGK